MVAIPVPQRVVVPLAPLGGACAGLLVAIVLLAVPTSLIESAVGASGIAAVLPAAEPPLGATARAALAFVLGSGMGVLVWCALLLALGTRGLTLGKRGLILPESPRNAQGPSGRDDAPPRRAPVLATRELGTPFLEVRAKPAAAERSADGPPPAAAPVERSRAAPATYERSLPRDFNAPLAAYDPAAIPDVPAEPVRPVAPLAEHPPWIEPAAPEMHIEALELAPPIVVAAAPAPEPVDPIATPSTDATIHALLDRLERGVARRDAAAAAAAAASAANPGDSVENTLPELGMIASR